MTSAPQSEYFSRYGGLWVDRRDADALLEQRLSSGEVTSSDAEVLRAFIRDGFVILPGAVEPSVCDHFERAISTAWVEGDERLKVQTGGSSGYEPLKAGTRTERARVVDSYVYYDAARRALFAEPIVHFLTLIFDAPPLLFQSLSFDQGSEQGMHQDTAYVVVNSPLELAASWIALEDVRPGSGELMYYVGSHRLPEYDFSGQFKHWNAERDGHEQHTEWSKGLNTNAERLGMERQAFLPKKGDVLIWAADLAHGGSPVTDRNHSRRSLVGHYCPLNVSPHYFEFSPENRGIVHYGDAAYSSGHYVITPDTPSDGAGPGDSASKQPSAGSRLAAAWRRLTG
jgi:hypothetical protein